jgi:hypothetical protein
MPLFGPGIIREENCAGGEVRRSTNPIKQPCSHQYRTLSLLLSNTPLLPETLATRFAPYQTFSMRPLAALLVVVALGFCIYEFYLKKMPTTDSGTAPTQAISLTGVRSDLLQIAQAERGSVATNGHCSSLDDLISSGSLTMTKPERDGYTYQVTCSGADFQVIAEHPPAPEGSPIRYPTISIDSNMEVKSN